MNLGAADALLRLGRRPAIAAGLGLGLLIYFVAHVTRFHLSVIWPLAPSGDASILFDSSRLILERGDYPARLALGNMNSVFPYPPSAVLLLGGLAAAGPAAFMAAWLVLMATGLWVMLRAGFAGERPDIVSAWLLLAALALVVADGPVAWDLRNANSNLVALGLVVAAYALAARRPAIAGVLIGLSISLKLYSGLLLLWLLANGPRPALYAGALTCIFLWLLLPAAVFGAAGALHLYLGWIEQLRIIADPWVYSMLAAGQGGPPIVTLRRAVMWLLGTDPGAAQTRALVLAMWVLWLAALLAYAWRARKTGAAIIPSRAALADWTVLLLAPLPFSPWLEPYHALPILIGALLLLTILLDQCVSRRDRWIAFAGVLALGLIRLVEAPFAIRGIGLLAAFLILVGALAALRPRLAPAPLAGSLLRSEQ